MSAFGLGGLGGLGPSRPVRVVSAGAGAGAGAEPKNTFFIGETLSAELAKLCIIREASCDGAEIPKSSQSSNATTLHATSVATTSPVRRAVSVPTGTGKRQYLGDYNSFSPTTALVMVLWKSTLPACVEYSLYDLRLQKWREECAARESEDSEEYIPAPTFDWWKQLNDIKKALIRHITTDFVLIKYFERLAINKLPLSQADKLTKNINRSLIRKLSKFPRMKACYRGFFSTFRGSTLLTLAMLTYDILEQLVTFLPSFSGGNKNPKEKSPNSTTGVIGHVQNIGRGILWLCRRVSYHTITMAFRSAGLSLGTYALFGNVVWGGGLGSLVFDLAGVGVCQLLLLV